MKTVTIIIILLVILSCMIYIRTGSKEYFDNVNSALDNGKTNNIGGNKIVGFANIDNFRTRNQRQDTPPTPVVLKAMLPYFNKIKFNVNYKDYLTAIEDLVPSKKQYFNIANIPIEKYSIVSGQEILPMINDFVELFSNIAQKNAQELAKYQYSGYLTGGWQDSIDIDRAADSGWDKVQKSLGLKPSLYGKEAAYGQLELIAIKEVQKFETDDEIKYVATLVLHKINTLDQMVAKVSLVLDKKIIRDEDAFWKVPVKYDDTSYTFKPSFNIQMIVEDIDVLGYLTSKQTNETDSDGVNELYCDYNDLEFSNITDPKYIQKVLMDKYKQRNDEINKRNATLDSEGQEFHRSMMGTYDYPNIKITQTIFDDMNKPRDFY